jgi:uncharacterized NAD-dependent epimerase/dehydratase family protein
MTLPFSTPPSTVIDLPRPYLLFLGDVTAPGYAKTAFGLKDWAPDLCVGELKVEGCTVTTGLESLSPEEAYARGARGVVIGVASVGGALLESWVAPLIACLDAGLDIVSGMHTRLEEVPLLKAAVDRTGRQFIEVRRPPPGLPVGTGKKRSGRRLLTVGTDCALGKKYTALALAKAFRARGLAADFRATGQTGIMIAGSGIPVDSVVADFISGAAELLSPEGPPDHWDVIEGQGSLFHPGYAGVSLGLLHGSQADVLVVCHEPGRTVMLGTAGFAVPSLEETIALNLKQGGLTNPAIRCGGISLNTSALSAEEAERALSETSKALGLPAADPIRGGARFDALVEACLA